MLTENQELYKKMENAIRNMHCEVHAIYEPDGGFVFGQWYSAAVDMFAPGFTFHVYFSLSEDGSIKVELVERWNFG